MKIKHYFTSEGDPTVYEETFDVETNNPEAWVKETLSVFNLTLRPHEKFRTTVKVEILDPSNDNKHTWVKRTDGMSVNFRGRVTDLFYCQKCGITGKRFRLGAEVKIDSKFKKMKQGFNIFLSCSEAKAELAKNPERYQK